MVVDGVGKLAEGLLNRRSDDPIVVSLKRWSTVIQSQVSYSIW